MKVIREPEKNDLDDIKTNCLILTSPERFIFNDYKTYKAYKQQIITILDPTLLAMIKEYIKINNINDGDYLISQSGNRNKY